MEKTKGMMKKTCKMAKNVIKKTQELFELSQINMKIISYKNKIERKFVKIGYCVYKKQEKSGLSALSEEIVNEKFKLLCEEIKKLYKKIAELEEERNEIKGCCEKGDCEKREKNKNEHKYSIEMEDSFENSFGD